MKTHFQRDNAEQFQSPAERLALSMREKRMAILRTFEDGPGYKSFRATEDRNKKLLGSTTMNGNQIFNPRIVPNVPDPRPSITIDQDAYDKVALQGNYAPLRSEEDNVLWTDLPKDETPVVEHRAFNEPLAALKDVDPNATIKLDPESARKSVDEALRNIPDTTLELPL